MPQSRKKTITSHSIFSANVVFSNEGLLTEILLRLPVKSLVQCKCISKKWRSLISSPHFTRLRIPYFSPARGIFLYHSSFFTNPFHKFVSFNLENPIPTPFLKFPFAQHDSPKIFIMQSCNGLLLCCTKHNPFTFNEDYYIFNPTTRQFITLPRPGGDVIGMSLAFDPWKSPHYKVICLRISELEPENDQIEIYSSESKKWRVSGPSFPKRYDLSFRHGLVYWNGAIYVSYIKRFNLEQEKFEIFPMPNCFDGQEWDKEDHRIVYFGESYGYLHLIQVNRQKLTLYNIYEMKNDGTEWFLKYEVNVEDVVSGYPRMIRRYLEPTDFHYYAMAVVNVVRGEKEEDTFLVLHIPEMAILRYNLADKSFHMLCDFDRGQDKGILEEFDEELAVCLHFHSSSTYQYIESTYYW
ncbi:F-box protein At5g07610-like [Nicotiana sylvestris]|uniref:F-box protein At5g07610-like n=1 Tax=Nicotiana sylvestris TaxID=4096 RepID=A0A1U7XAF5_NICSY|nr:PREDICTED: F-box protein At5g07610-like [Nicotiana sylvestris]